MRGIWRACVSLAGMEKQQQQKAQQHNVTMVVVIDGVRAFAECTTLEIVRCTYYTLKSFRL